MNIKPELLYTQSHEWVKVEGDQAYIGISDYAQDALGDIVFVNLPDVGQSLSQNDEVCDIESVKAVSMLYAPIQGDIIEINEALNDSPELLNQDPYGTWIIKLSSIANLDNLLDANAYKAFLEKGE